MSKDTIEGREPALPGSEYRSVQEHSTGNGWCAAHLDWREARFKVRAPSIVREQGQQWSERTIHG
jgi:hypothetical protein